MPAKKLIVCIWSVPTQHSQTVPLNVRMHGLKKAVHYANSLIDASGRSDGISPKGVFVAPEYLFARPAATPNHTVGMTRHIEESDQDDLFREMIALSREVRDLLIIPGTVAWRRPFGRIEESVDAVRQNAGLLFGGDLRQPVSGPLYGVVPAMSSGNKLAKLGSVGLVDADEFRAENTAYVLLNGTLLFKYNKRSDFHEVLTPTGGTIHVPGILDGRFEVRTNEAVPRTIQFGLEICLDHSYGTLRRATQRGRVDVHIITSAATTLIPSHVAVKHNGYLVHACSNQWQSEVRLEGWSVPHFNESGSAPLRLYDLTLNSLGSEPQAEPAPLPLPPMSLPPSPATLFPPSPAMFFPLSPAMLFPPPLPMSFTPSLLMSLLSWPVTSFLPLPATSLPPSPATSFPLSPPLTVPPQPQPALRSVAFPVPMNANTRVIRTTTSKRAEPMRPNNGAIPTAFYNGPKGTVKK
ncbi:hypothetical protein FAZ69_15740 [Trinickia terrae]|uniref:Uncharacterized protein n=1 Tax=Trinickia terrae TaxID=2571161 RepID=A0A4U1I3D6_9BURK|nr:hypothetical protein [Trinickia terrae]TKC87738.1 hypothetical protein FAZ69_15740 [Trinickia terrae]